MVVSFSVNSFNINKTQAVLMVVNSHNVNKEKEVLVMKKS